MFVRTSLRRPVTTGTVQQRFGHDHHNEHGTGWPKPSGRGQFQPAQKQDVERALSQSRELVPDEVRKEAKSLEGWLFGKKVIYLNTKDPWYNQIPNEQQYLFAERVCNTHLRSYILSHCLQALNAKCKIGKS
jgi:hypothetical protein